MNFQDAGNPKPGALVLAEMTVSGHKLPLLITVHFALTSRGPIPALFYGMFIGLVQDSLSRQPIGMYGIVKTLVGYFAASVSMRFDVQNPVVTFILAFFFY